MNKKKLKKDLAGIGKDVLVAFVIVAVIMLGLYAYSGIWPPMVVIESGSMEHPPEPGDIKSYIGVIDTGDMVFVKKVNGTNDLVTYVQGEATGQSNYGAYGDVVVYRPNGLKYRGDGTPVIPIIHRLVLWVDINSSNVSPDFNGIDYANYSFDVPVLELYDTTDVIILTNYGYREDTVTIRLGLESGGLMWYYETRGIIPHGGYITMGDNNAPAYDQPAYEPVQPDWIIGKAWGELPWFGLVKLWFTGAYLDNVASNSWVGLFSTLIILVLFPLILEYAVPIIKKYLKKDEEPDKTTEPKSGPDEVTPEEIDPGDGPVPEEGNDSPIIEEKPPEMSVPVIEIDKPDETTEP